MKELIDRQQAIDKMVMLPKYFDKTGTLCLDYADVLAVLSEHLPSAQPEIVYCKDCKHYNAGFECLIEGYGIERNKDWFCGDAERRTDD